MNASPRQLDALRELINIGIGKAAALLNEMLSAHIQLHVPRVEIIAVADLESVIDRLGGGVTAAVQLSFRGPFNGSASLVFADEGANRLVDLLK